MIPPVREIDSCSHSDPPPIETRRSCKNPGALSLAAKKLEANIDRRNDAKSQKSRIGTPSRGVGIRKSVTRSCKIMKEAFFKVDENVCLGPVVPK